MKATLVYNTKEEPRVRLELETAEERQILRDAPNLVCVMVGHNLDENGENGQLDVLAYAFQSRDDT